MKFNPLFIRTFIALTLLAYAGFANANNSKVIPPVVALLLADEEEQQLAGPIFAVGREHSCAILRDQTVQCWGRNDDGQLGNNSLEDSFTPVTAMGVTGAVSIYAGFETSCASLEDGSVKCWGERGNNLLGDQGSGNQLTPITIDGLNGSLDFGVGQGFSCQIRPDQSVSCAGSGSSGQQGDGSTDRNEVYTPVIGVANAVELDVSRDHACVIIEGGSVQCWGDNGDGQTGIGDDDPRDVTLAVTVPGISNAIALGLSEDASCALLADQTIKCWGDNGDGQIGNGSDNVDEFIPQTVTGITNAVSIAGDEDNSCALLSDQTVRCWGDNQKGILNNGDQSFQDQNTPQISQNLSNVMAIGVGEEFMCVISGTNSANRKVQCVGDNSNGQLGVESNRAAQMPTETTAFNQNVEAIAAGSSHSCALTATGTVACWGGNTQGQLGLGSLEHRTEPGFIPGVSTGVDLDAGAATTCVVLMNGEVQCWGRNSSGQLGNGTTVGATSPVTVSNISTAEKVAVGNGHACALLSSGSIACWGSNFSGQLGTSTANSSSTTPVMVDDVTTATDVFSGPNTSCAILASGKMHCWGSGLFNVLAPTDNTTPATVTGLNSVTDIAMDGLNVCAVNNNELFCWGHNLDGQLTISVRETNIPTKIASLSNVTAVGLSDSTVCAATDDGNNQNVFCWGDNSRDALGIGETDIEESNMPIQLTDISSVDQFTHFARHFCALSNPRTVQCWGDNTFGTIGDGTRGFSDVPNDVDIELQ